MKTLRGIFPALQATFEENGDIDIGSMERQVEHCIEAGTHGLVFPVMGGEIFYLSEAERQALVEAVIGTAKGQVPVVVGVSGPSTSQAVERAVHAKKARADAVIALPPYVEHADETYTRDYYQRVSEAAELPMFVQHTWPGMSPDFIASLIEDFEHICYVKEETRPSGHSISAVIEAVGNKCRGVFGGAHGYWMIPEMRRGASGFIPAAQCTEAYVAIWDAFQNGEEAKAREIYTEIRPFLDLLSHVGLRLCKEVLVRRGVIKTATMRVPVAPKMDDHDRYELELALKKLEPFFLV